MQQTRAALQSLQGQHDALQGAYTAAFYAQQQPPHLEWQQQQGAQAADGGGGVLGVSGGEGGQEVMQHWMAAYPDMCGLLPAPSPATAPSLTFFASSTASSRRYLQTNWVSG